MSELSSIESARYARHFSLAEIGEEGQKRLKKAKVLCIGAGGLGSTVLYYLAAAGVGEIGIVDPDRVALSNLQRQILYSSEDVGALKVEAAQQRLHALNPHSVIHPYAVRLDEDNALAIMADYDVVVDATDNYAARYLINDACCSLGKADVFAAILRFQGQCSVFGLADSPCYRCLYPQPPAAHSSPNCAEAGVLGVLPGLLGCLQATEVLKLLLGTGESLQGRLLQFDALSARWSEFRVQRHPHCPICAEQRSFHDLARPLFSCAAVPELSIQEFKALRQQRADFILLDVRERDEYLKQHMNGYLIPLSELPERVHELDRSQLIIIHCQSGVRSLQAAALLLSYGFKQIRNLQGGMSAWLSDE